MGNFNPSSTALNVYPVSIRLTGNVSYGSFVNSLGTYVYGLDKIYMRCSNIAQLSNPITYNYYDANGDSQQYVLSPTIDPYQKYPSLIVDKFPNDLFLDGNTSMSFTLNANQTLTFTLISKEIKEKDRLNKGSYNPSDRTIQFQLVNVTNTDQNITIFNNESESSVNAYVFSSSYNLSAETYATTNIRPVWIYVRLNGEQTFTSGASFPVTTLTNINELVTLLNTNSYGIVFSNSGTTLYSNSPIYVTGQIGIGTLPPF
jgi:hypothetical protein